MRLPFPRYPKGIRKDLSSYLKKKKKKSTAAAKGVPQDQLATTYLRSQILVLVYLGRGWGGREKGDKDLRVD